MTMDLCKIAAAKPYGSICKLAGKAWIPVKGFESHLDDELALQVDGSSGVCGAFLALPKAIVILS